MSRYEAEHYSEQWMVWDEVLGHHIMSSDGDLLESAAHIIAYALNTVAEGRLLASDDKDFQSAEVAHYDGPTEGVAS